MTCAPTHIEDPWCHCPSYRTPEQQKWLGLLAVYVKHVRDFQPPKPGDSVEGLVHTVERLLGLYP
jgi:hypothetical protein